MDKIYCKIVNEAPYGIFVSDLEGNFTLVNQYLCKILGFAEDELLAMNLSNLYLKPKTTPLANIDKEETIRTEGHLRTKNKEQFFAGLIFKKLNSNLVQGLIYDFPTKQSIIEQIMNKERMAIAEEHLQYAKNLQQNFNDIVFSITAAQEYKDPYTAGHQNKVCILSLEIGRELKLAEERLKGLELGSHLHDIGKIGIPSELLTKPTKLSSIEYELLKTHPEAGFNILKNIQFPWPIAEFVHQHHERLNGQGYPKGLKADEILFEAKIIAVADVVDAMASHRPYRASLGVNKAIEEILSGKDERYDSTVVLACEKVLRSNRLDLYNL